MNTKEKALLDAQEKFGPNVVLTDTRELNIKPHGYKLVGILEGDTVTYLAMGGTWAGAIAKAWKRHLEKV